MANPILEKLLADREGAAVCWLGNLSWLIRAGGRLIATDLDLHLDMRINDSPVPAEDIAPRLDVHFLTHEHEDHFNSTTCRILAQGGDCLFVVPGNCAEKARGLGIAEDRIRVAEIDQPFEIEDIHIEPHRAFHGSQQHIEYRPAHIEDNGYRIQIGGKTFFQPGDTVLLKEHLGLTDIDVLFVSPTKHNMHIDPSARFIDAVRPSVILPQHFGTYAGEPEHEFWTIGYPDELKAALPKPMQDRFHKLEQGQVFVIE